MAKKKVNKRTDYDAEKRDIVYYERSRIQRKMNFLILRGPGLIQKDVIEENEAIKKFALLQHFKVKFVQVRMENEAVDWLKDANTWAGGVVYHPGSFIDYDGEIKQTIKKILIPVQPIPAVESVNAETYLAALQTLIQKLPKK